MLIARTRRGYFSPKLYAKPLFGGPDAADLFELIYPTTVDLVRKIKFESCPGRAVIDCHQEQNLRLARLARE